jgi:hypothetical protein
MMSQPRRQRQKTKTTNLTLDQNQNLRKCHRNQLETDTNRTMRCAGSASK